MPTRGSAPTLAIRFEGGLGDHILGMRLLPFAHAHAPRHAIVAYSDAGGESAQSDILAMSPLVSRIVPLRHRAQTPHVHAFGKLDNIHPDDLEAMRSADLFIDAHGEKHFIAASIELDVPLLDILACRPPLQIAATAREAAAQLLAAHEPAIFVGLNLTKSQPCMLRDFAARLHRVIDCVLRDPRVVLLNVYSAQAHFHHWPDPWRADRRRMLLEEQRLLAELSASHDRIVACANLPLPTVAALLERCRYFVGVDNGVKHLAWALGVPLTYYNHEKPTIAQVLRWMPDVHRLVLLTCGEEAFETHLAGLAARIAALTDGGAGRPSRAAVQL